MPAREVPWTFMLLVLVCACVVAVGFFFAARQHFTSMDYGIKNSRLREQLQNLETEKRRLLLAREVASSPLAIRRAATAMGLRQNSEVAAVQASAARPADKITAVAAVPVKASTKSSDAPVVIRTVLTAPVPAKSTGETRSRVVSSPKDKKDKTEVAALLKLR